MTLGIGFGGGVQASRRHWIPTRNPAAQAIRDYASLCHSEIVEPLRRRNDGTLTGEDIAQQIESASGAIRRRTWSTLAEQATQLQADDGTIPQDQLDDFLSTLSAGLTSY